VSSHAGRSRSPFCRNRAPKRRRFVGCLRAGGASHAPFCQPCCFRGYCPGCAPPTAARRSERQRAPATRRGFQSRYLRRRPTPLLRHLVVASEAATLRSTESFVSDPSMRIDPKDVISSPVTISIQRSRISSTGTSLHMKRAPSAHDASDARPLQKKRVCARKPPSCAVSAARERTGALRQCPSALSRAGTRAGAEAGARPVRQSTRAVRTRPGPRAFARAQSLRTKPPASQETARVQHASRPGALRGAWGGGRAWRRWLDMSSSSSLVSLMILPTACAPRPRSRASPAGRAPAPHPPR